MAPKWIVQCKLSRRGSIGCSDGSVWVERSLDNGDTISYTVTWLEEKVANVGREVTLRHPDGGRDVTWTIIERWARKQPPKMEKKP